MNVDKLMDIVHSPRYPELSTAFLLFMPKEGFMFIPVNKWYEPATSKLINYFNKLKTSNQILWVCIETLVVSPSGLFLKFVTLHTSRNSCGYMPINNWSHLATTFVYVYQGSLH